jgi:hypothetical protein
MRTEVDVRITESDQIVTCTICGAEVPKKAAVGVGVNTEEKSWHCTPCVLGGSLDEVFGSIGRLIDLLSMPEEEGEA